MNKLALTFIACMASALTLVAETSPHAQREENVIAEGLRAQWCNHVETALIPKGVHYLVEDQPEAVVDLIERYAAP